MQKRLIYELLDKRKPIIEGNRVVVDSGVGGIKLVYKVKHYKLRDIFGIKLKSLVPIKTETIVFLRPYKKVWDKKRNRLPKNYWGKIKSPLTNLWVTVIKDYDGVPGSIPIVRIKKHIKNHDLIRYLNKATDHFSLTINN